MATENGSLQREVGIPSDVIRLLDLMGIKIPGNIKEIRTPVENTEETQKILLPIGMDKLTAAKELEAQYKNEETTTDFSSSFEGWNWQDVLVAVKKVTEDAFGWMNGQKHPWTGDPTEIDVVVDIKKGKKISEKAFYGNFEITGWEKAKASLNVNRAGVVSININAKRKYSSVITNYFHRILKHLETASIYRGKNIVVTMDGNNRLDFEIIENKGSDKIVLNRAETMVVDTFVIGGLEEHGKRCYLFTGAYGTGKTETAMRVGRVAVDVLNMSFFYLKDAKAFDFLLNQSKKYQPCIIFLEDVDEIGSGEQRDAQMNKILNTLDGVQTKGNDLTVIFTTNHPEKINSALRRPGRIDLMVKFEYPDLHSRQEIFRLYFRDLPGSDLLDYEKLAKLTVDGEKRDVQGAVVAEIAKRSVKLAKARSGTISDDIVETCIHSMKYQIELMADPVSGKTMEQQFAESFGDVMSKYGPWSDENAKQLRLACGMSE